MTHARWEAAIRDMEDELNLHEAALREGTVQVIPAFVPPEELGEVPPSLRNRAVQLSERVQLLATFVRYQLVAVDGDLRHLKDRDARPPGVSLYLDNSV